MLALTILLGLAEGLLVGTAIMAVITLLEIVPRLTQLTDTAAALPLYEWMLALGATLASLAVIVEGGAGLPAAVASLAGLGAGIFVGLLTGALAEVLNVIPIMTRRLRLWGHLRFLMWLLVSGKVAGSLFYSLFPQLW